MTNKRNENKLSACLSSSNKLKTLLLAVVWGSSVVSITWRLSVLPSVQSDSNSPWVQEKVDSWPEGSRSAVLHQEGGAWHYFREERAQNQPLPGAGRAQLLSEVSLSWKCSEVFICTFYRWIKMIVWFCREILNEERCPGFLLEAVRSAIRKRRKLIKAKMLGIPENECSSRSVLNTLNTHHHIQK